jgi:hypothetical protein
LRRSICLSLPTPHATGALAATFMTILRHLARQTRLPGATDDTCVAFRSHFRACPGKSAHRAQYPRYRHSTTRAAPPPRAAHELTWPPWCRLSQRRQERRALRTCRSCSLP